MNSSQLFVCSAIFTKPSVSLRPNSFTNMNYQPSNTPLTSADAAMILTTLANNTTGVAMEQPPDQPILWGAAMDEAIWESLKTQIQAQLRHVIVDPAIWERLMSHVHGQLLAMTPDECYYRASELQNLAHSGVGKRYQHLHNEMEPFASTNHISGHLHGEVPTMSPIKSFPSPSSSIHRNGGCAGSSPIFSPLTFGNHGMAPSSKRVAIVQETMASKPAGRLWYPSAKQPYTLFDSPDKSSSSGSTVSTSSAVANESATRICYSSKQEGAHLPFESPDDKPSSSKFFKLTAGHSPVLSPLSFGNHGTPSPWKSALLASATAVSRPTKNIEYPSKKLDTLFGSPDKPTSSENIKPSSPNSFNAVPVTVVSKQSLSLDYASAEEHASSGRLAPLFSCNSKPGNSSNIIKVSTTKKSKKSNPTKAKKLRGKLRGIRLVKKASTKAWHHQS